jgi:probable F420-dependent oxidoreductase
VQVDFALSPDGTVDIRAQAAAVQAEGFDGLWLSEVKHDPFIGVALAATVTERPALGTAIALAFARNPMSTAAAANDLQALSQGRLILGLGTQVKAHITRRFSMPWSHPAARMREYVLALRAIWDTWHTGAPLDFRGDFYSHTLMSPMFVPEQHGFGAPRVVVAGVGQAMTEVAGEVADGFLPHGFTTERYLREVTVPALLRGRSRLGAGLEGFAICGGPFVVTGTTEEEMAAAEEQVRGQIAFYGSTPAYRPVLELHGWGALGDELHELTRAGRWAELGGLVSDEVLRTFAVVGAPDEIGPEILRRYGDLFTRVTLYGLARAHPQIGETLRAAPAAMPVGAPAAPGGAA